MTPAVTLESALTARATVENLFQFYVHDFADFWATRQVELGEDGRFPFYPPLTAFWNEPGAEPLLIRADGQIAGFALIDRHSHSGLPCDFDMGEFFVARHYRREGVGRAAALMAMRERPGLWEIAIARRNLPAQPFWRSIAATLAPDGYEDLDRNDAHWNGPVLRVRVG